MKDLYKSLKILSAELVPWHNLKKQDENEGVRVEDLLFIVDTMLEEVENKAKVILPNTYIDIHILNVKLMIWIQIFYYNFLFLRFLLKIWNNFKM